MSCIASSVSRRIASGSTFRKVWPSTSTVDDALGRDQPVGRLVRWTRWGGGRSSGTLAVVTAPSVRRRLSAARAIREHCRSSVGATSTRE